MRMKKIILAVVILFSLLFSINVKAVTEENPDEALNLIEGAKAGILIEQSSKEILYQKEMDRRLSPASMTKIMTLLLIYEAMENNQFNLDTMLTTSETAASMGGSQVYLKVGEKISVDEALKCVCVASANDCAVLLAEEVSGSEEYFVRKMNEKAKSLGCNNTNFSDCTGLTSQNHYTSAYDLAIISAELLTKYPEVIKYTTIKEDYIRKDTSSPFWLVNTNKMIGRVEGLNGLKTGHTSFSGYCITLSMSKDDMNLISVVFGYDSATKRNSESLELLKYGFSNYKLNKVVAKGNILQIVNHILYKDDIEVIALEDIYHLVKKNEELKYDIKYDFKINKDSCEGTINVYLNDEIVGSGKVGSSSPIKRKNIFEIFASVVHRALG